ncbi:MAG TPA: hypothetical protein VGJ20_28870 [Xanthobacteraceae bacterium]|jgi:hypothetical protein
MTGIGFLYHRSYTTFASGSKQRRETCAMCSCTFNYVIKREAAGGAGHLIWPIIPLGFFGAIGGLTLPRTVDSAKSMAHERAQQNLRASCRHRLDDKRPLHPTATRFC